jgi:MoaA/NifB/PqqE/SkfB family radical SAM enzyme
MDRTHSHDTQAGEQISTWIRADASRPYCARPWRQIAVLSDGTAVCACIDAGKTNPLGNVFESSLAQVWDGPAYQKLRRDVEEDIERVPICRGCPNRIKEAPPAGHHSNVPRPRVLFLESYAGCNLACPGCDRGSIEGTRDDLMMDFDKYSRLIDDLSPDLRYMEFHVGGENWMHRRAAEMVTYCKTRNPECIVLSSTNGHFFHTEQKARQAIETGIDCLIFSIDGAVQESYEKYRVRGNIQRAFEGMQRVLRIRNEMGRRRPLVIWRYILFAWNSSPEEMDQARVMAREFGIDSLAWHLNGAQDEFSSARYYIGSPHLIEIKDELWDTYPQRIGWDVDLGFASYP